jgi:hypothetical protein
MIDELLGQGGLDERFTDWDTARNFVIFDTIVNNPRFDDETKIKLQDMEQDAYAATSGKWTQSETEEIGRYYNYLKNNFPSITNDQRFLSIFDAADTVQASDSEALDAKDFAEGSKKIGKNVFYVLIGLAALAVFTRD